MATARTLMLALLFGAADQALGSLSAHGWGDWTFAASQMSAPWLVLPFLAGMTQPSLRRGIALGLGATCAGLLGYFVMTLIPGQVSGPLRWVSLANVNFSRFLRFQSGVLLGGAVTGPVFGLLGARWRLAGRWWGPASLAACTCLEPLARAATDRLPPGTGVWMAEVAVGVAGALLIVMLRARRIDGST